jgi:hypothetical protein
LSFKHRQNRGAAAPATGKNTRFSGTIGLQTPGATIFWWFVTSLLARIRFHPLFCRPGYSGWKHIW